MADGTPARRYLSVESEKDCWGIAIQGERVVFKELVYNNLGESQNTMLSETNQAKEYTQVHTI